MSLRKLIRYENHWNPPVVPFDINSITHSEAESLFQRLDENLDPAWLWCSTDNDIQMKRRESMFRTAFSELIGLGFTPAKRLNNLP